MESARPGEGVVRCFGGEDELYRRYHDHEWGRPVVDERSLYERICLEGFQCGLSWLVVLRKREALRRAFYGFDPEAVAAFDAADVDRLFADPSIIRNRAKIEAAIANARATVRLGTTDTPLPRLIWSYRPERQPAPRSFTDVPVFTRESVALSKALKQAGFRFVGPATTYALMEAVGLVNDHLAACVVRPEVAAEQARDKLALG